MLTQPPRIPEVGRASRPPGTPSRCAARGGAGVWHRLTAGDSNPPSPTRGEGAGEGASSRSATPATTHLAHNRYTLPTPRRRPPSILAPRPSILLLLALLIPACSDPPNKPAPPASTAATPTQTIRELRELHAAQRYRELPPLIVPHWGQQTVDTLMALDEFLAANSELCQWVRTNVGVGLARSVDQSYFADELGNFLGNSMNIFARHAELLDETITADRATVAFTVDHQLPAQQAQLIKTDNRWRYDPGGAFSHHFPAAFKDMAAGLRAARLELDAGRPSITDIQNNPQSLLDKIESRLRRGVRRLSQGRAEIQPKIPNSTP